MKKTGGVLLHSTQHTSHNPRTDYLKIFLNDEAIFLQIDWSAGGA